MLDFTKFTFNELDDTDKPLQAFYNYDLKESKIDDFLEEYTTVEEVPESVSIYKSPARKPMVFRPWNEWRHFACMVKKSAKTGRCPGFGMMLPRGRYHGRVTMQEV